MASLFSLVHQQVYSLQRWCLPPFSQYNVIGYNVRLIQQISHYLDHYIIIGCFYRYTMQVYRLYVYKGWMPHAWWSCLMHQGSLCIFKKIKIWSLNLAEMGICAYSQMIWIIHFLKWNLRVVFLFSYFLIGLQRNLNFSWSERWKLT